ncbi:serine/arginine-rich splicing factor sr45a [Phtheirospermum japonicum]|uniref:Serine/arginine-rich splicing factor sr45a n=1 Tax=Phtheirospermum japonicum TaxID=374723 RepID=A0A830B779_9LAMI|nr:serine/arginine-rich splicing factor sr45a [Phtheirospermum japonicum]
MMITTTTKSMTSNRIRLLLLKLSMNVGVTYEQMKELFWVKIRISIRLVHASGPYDFLQVFVTYLPYWMHAYCSDDNDILGSTKLESVCKIYNPDVERKSKNYYSPVGDYSEAVQCVVEKVFWCFVGFMKKAHHNFRLDEAGIRRQLNTISKTIKYKDSHLYRHLKKLKADDCFFVYRMVVVLFRRELSFEQTLCLWEVMWADQAAIRAGIGKSAWSRIRQRAPPTDDLLFSVRGEEIGNEKMTVILDLQQIAFKNDDRQMIVVAQNGKTGNMSVDSMYMKALYHILPLEYITVPKLLNKFQGEASPTTVRAKTFVGLINVILSTIKVRACGWTLYSRSPSPYRRYSRSVSRSLSRSRSRSRDSSDVENPGNNLYVTGLSIRVTRKDLEKHFSTEGKVEDVHLVIDPLTRESRGFGFVTMSNLEEAERCIKHLDRSVLEGRVITVEKVAVSQLCNIKDDCLPRVLYSCVIIISYFAGQKAKGADTYPGKRVAVLVHVATRPDTHPNETIGGVEAGPTLLITADAVDRIPLTEGVGRILLRITAVGGLTPVLALHRTITAGLLTMVSTIEVAIGTTPPRMIATIAEGIGTEALLHHRDIIISGDIIGEVYHVVSRQGVAQVGTTLEACHHLLPARGVGLANERPLLIADPREGILGVLVCFLPLLGLGLVISMGWFFY